MKHFRQPRPGLTLIEVIAAVALLGMLMVAILTAKARHTRQWALADRKLAAVHAADVLLSGWWSDIETFPRDDRGEVPGLPEAQWVMQPLRHEVMEELDLQVVRLEVWGLRSGEDEPLASVELIVPMRPEDRPELQSPDGPKELGGGD